VTKAKRVGDVGQVVEHLPGKCEGAVVSEKEEGEKGGGGGRKEGERKRERERKEGRKKEENSTG
jgi:hypothetical protein